MSNVHPQLTRKLVVTVLIICLGSVQFGYHIAELNSPEKVISCNISIPDHIPYIESWFGSHGFAKCIPLRTEQISFITSIFSIGGLLGSLCAGTISDKIGKKSIILLYCLLYFIGSLFNGLGNTYYILLLGRFIVGLGGGAAIVITSIFINDIAPSNYKGLLGSMNQISINIGILLTQLLSLKWSTNNYWRFLLLTGSFIALINYILIELFVDESPVWLFNNEFSSKAFHVLHDLRGCEFDDAKNEVMSWRTIVEGTESLLNEEEQNRDHFALVDLKTYIRSPIYHKCRTVSTGILVMQQFCGINSIIFYGVSNLISIFPKHAIFINCLISSINLLVTIGSAPLIDKLGRKPLLLTSVLMMGLSTIFMGEGYLLNSRVLCIIGNFAYISFFAIGLGPIPLLLISEITPPEAKASAQSWGMTMSWLAMFIIGFLFPMLRQSWIGDGVYFIFTIMCAFTYFFIKWWVPETKGMNSYEQVWKNNNIVD